jgi:hypothetical protein
MNIKSLTLLILTMLTPLSFAQIPPGQWLCYAFDAQKQSYEGLGDSIKSAMKNADANCVKKSHQSRHCKIAQSYCEQGPLSLIDDRCVVSDTNGRSWNATGTDACKIALNMCTRWQFLHGKTSQCSVKHF